ncbi:MAG TPA: HD domain-containing protein [Bacteroidales bacterium]|nr:HD domain-containing protein [Bacteroidales bacterium]HSA43625.1 HD domain-containing protein [Bacteroidales bacterium]
MLPGPNNKRKIINDPVYGFITIPDELLFDVIEHPFFQRLRRIKQLGLTHLVYPGALHTRFHHALGAMYLVNEAIESLRWKGIDISPDEEQAVLLAILLHDIGHGPFSHALENCIVYDVTHEELSLLFMEHLNKVFGGQLDMAIRIFRNLYPKKFLHQMVSGQLDMDRMDYLKRDSFYTGVSEGVINSDRLLNMLTVADDELVVEAKGIYSVEKFIVARRLMYWQVYLHKTVLAAEQMLVHTLRRAKYLAENGHQLFATPSLAAFLKNRYGMEDFRQSDALLGMFARLDDSDISASFKVWTDDSDSVLSFLSSSLVNRQLFRIEISKNPFDPLYVDSIRTEVCRELKLHTDDVPYFLYEGEIANNAYNPSVDRINILHRDGRMSDITQDSAQLNVSVLSETVTNYFLCYPKVKI